MYSRMKFNAIIGTANSSILLTKLNSNNSPVELAIILYCVKELKYISYKRQDFSI